MDRVRRVDLSILYMLCLNILIVSSVFAAQAQFEIMGLNESPEKDIMNDDDFRIFEAVSRTISINKSNHNIPNKDFIEFYKGLDDRLEFKSENRDRYLYQALKLRFEQLESTYQNLEDVKKNDHRPLDFSEKYSQDYKKKSIQSLLEEIEILRSLDLQDRVVDKFIKDLQTQAEIVDYECLRKADANLNSLDEIDRKYILQVKNEAQFQKCFHKMKDYLKKHKKLNQIVNKLAAHQPVGRPLSRRLKEYLKKRKQKNTFVKKALAIEANEPSGFKIKGQCDLSQFQALKSHLQQNPVRPDEEVSFSRSVQSSDIGELGHCFEENGIQSVYLSWGLKQKQSVRAYQEVAEVDDNGCSQLEVSNFYYYNSSSDGNSGHSKRIELGSSQEDKQKIFQGLCRLARGGANVGSHEKKQAVYDGLRVNPSSPTAK